MIQDTFYILLVDDRLENLYALEGMLTATNRTFLLATSGNDALKTALKTPNLGLIILDVQMPEMDGFEVASILKSNPKTRDISIIFATAINKEEKFVLKGYKSGAVDYLAKPLDINVTRAKVDVFERLYRNQKALEKAVEENEIVNGHLQRFMYIVAHDLKSPLNGINSILSYIQNDERVGTSPYLSENIDLCVKATNYLEGMITSILDYSKSRNWKEQQEEVVVEKLVKDIASLLYPPPGIKITIQKDMPLLITHRLKLQQVFQNLLSNAIKHHDKKQGNISVGFEPFIPSDPYIIFWIKDDGPGISEDDQYKMFNLFQTSSTKAENTGVGLNLVKMFIEEQGGKIYCKSELGKGSIFSFEWPLQIPMRAESMNMLS